MKPCILFIIGAVLVNVLEAPDPELQCPNNYTSTETQTKLMKQVFCKYDRQIRPVRSHNESVDVQISLSLWRLDFDDKKDILTILSTVYMSWHDYHLLWNSSDFSGINMLNVRSYLLWRPDLELYTKVNSHYPQYFYYTICQVYSMGEVICVPTVEHVSSCSADLTRWPFDSHTCRMIIGSWTHAGEEINVTFTDYPIMAHNYQMNREWDLISTRAYREVLKFACCPNETYPNLSFEFVLKRHSGVYAATVTIPGIVIMLMTLTTFWMDPGRFERLFIAATDLFCHFLFLQYLGTILPSNGDKTPLLATFYRDSLILTTMALFSAILGRNMKKSSQSVPLWASGITSWILHNRIGQIIVFHNTKLKTVADGSGTDNEESINASVSSWETFLALLDSVFFLVTFFVDVILILGFIP